MILLMYSLSTLGKKKTGFCVNIKWWGESQAPNIIQQYFLCFIQTSHFFFAHNAQRNSHVNVNLPAALPVAW